MVQSSYEIAAEKARTMLAEAEKALAEKGPNYKKNMPESYKGEMAKIKRLKRRVIYREGLIPKRGKTTDVSASQKARQELTSPRFSKKQKEVEKKEKPTVKTSQEMSPPERAKLGFPPFTRTESEKKDTAAQKDAQILKDIRAAEKEAEKESKEAKKAKSKVPAGISEIKDDRSGRKYKAKRKKARETKQADDITAAQKVRGAVDKMSAAERKSLGPVTNFMEKLLGLNRDKATIERDMKITEDLEKELGFSGGKKKGGRVKKQSISRKKYAMNRGGKVASIRKPTRA
jgi:hypothetical protein